MNRAPLRSSSLPPRAPEAIAELCHLPERDRAELRRAVDQMAQEGMRVLAVARACTPVGIARPTMKSWGSRMVSRQVEQSLLCNIARVLGFAFAHLSAWEGGAG
jgi:magnesium-transporting ATPase (P-type)